MGLNEEYKLNLPGEKTKVVSARLWKRFSAFALDLFLVYSLILGQLGRFFEGETSAQIIASAQTMPIGLAYVILSTSGLILLLYFTLFHYWNGQTPGMAIMGIRVQVDSFWKALIRNIYVIPLFPFSILWIVELFYLIYVKERWLAKITDTPTTEIIHY